MNIETAPQFHKCTSCQMCATICPTSAISIETINGFYTPNVDTDKCIDCGKCVSVCAKCAEIIDIDNKPRKVIAANAKDNAILYNSASGGIASTIAYITYERGYKVYGAKYDIESGKTLHMQASCKEDICSFAGSKYMQSLCEEAYEKILHNPKDKLVFFGTPCQVYALDRLLSKNGLR